ncbi:MAG TPA: polysaccharide deacetylase family protein [Patescibacteria group bacterium]|nr:polysaccharide deacetylase family protein [Patescibacteria group bacterium]
MNQLNLVKQMYLYRLLYVLSALVFGCLLVLSAHHLHEANMANTKSWENIYLSYKDRYDYNRFTGESQISSFFDSFIKNKVDASPSIKYTQTVPVLLYHRISDTKDPYNVTPANFKAQMFALKKEGYNTISIYDYKDFLQGKKKLPAKSFLLTFDDGTKDSFYPVQPILKALDFRATMFVITRYSILDPNGSHYYLSSIELKQMLKSGVWDIQPHTRKGHTYYQISPTNFKGTYYANKLWLKSQNRYETDQEYANRVYGDLAQSKSDIENLTHKPVVAFAFPFGEVGEDNQSNYANAYKTITDDVHKLFSTAMLQTYGGRGQSQNFYNSDSIYSYRVEADANWPKNPIQLINYFNLGAAKVLPFSDDLSSDKGWLTGNGQVVVRDKMLTINSIPRTDGASAILDGTTNWTDYEVTANAKLISGTSFDLTARNQGSADRIGCDFSENYIAIERQVGDQTKTVLDDNYVLPIRNNFESVGIKVEGHNIQCLVNGKVMVNMIDADMPKSGGPGFTVWDPTIKSIAQFTDIKVTPIIKS